MVSPVVSLPKNPIKQEIAETDSDIDLESEYEFSIKPIDISSDSDLNEETEEEIAEESEESEESEEEIAEESEEEIAEEEDPDDESEEDLDDKDYVDYNPYLKRIGEFPCTFCKRILTTKSALAMHELHCKLNAKRRTGRCSINKTLSFICMGCKRSFKRESLRTNHVNQCSAHKALKLSPTKFKCGYCPRTFKTTNARNSHVGACRHKTL